MPNISTYYPDPMFDKITETAEKVFGDDKRRRDKFIKGCIRYGINHYQTIFEKELEEKQ